MYFLCSFFSRFFAAYIEKVFLYILFMCFCWLVGAAQF